MQKRPKTNETESSVPQRTLSLDVLSVILAFLPFQYRVRLACVSRSVLTLVLNIFTRVATEGCWQSRRNGCYVKGSPRRYLRWHSAAQVLSLDPDNNGSTLSNLFSAWLNPEPNRSPNWCENRQTLIIRATYEPFLPQKVYCFVNFNDACFSELNISDYRVLELRNVAFTGLANFAKGCTLQSLCLRSCKMYLRPNEIWSNGLQSLTHLEITGIATKFGISGKLDLPCLESLYIFEMDAVLDIENSSLQELKVSHSQRFLDQKICPCEFFTMNTMVGCERLKSIDLRTMPQSAQTTENDISSHVKDCGLVPQDAFPKLKYLTFHNRSSEVGVSWKKMFEKRRAKVYIYFGEVFGRHGQLRVFDW